MLGFGSNAAEEMEIIENMVDVLKEMKWVNAFMVVFKQNDNRNTNGFFSMINLLEKMFGHKFWDHVVIAASHWCHAKIDRLESKPQLTMDFWSNQFNKKLQQNFAVNKNLSSVFIDSHAYLQEELEAKHFQQETSKLWLLIKNSNIFHCQDINSVLSELTLMKINLTKAQNTINSMNTKLLRFYEEREVYKK